MRAESVPVSEPAKRSTDKHRSKGRDRWQLWHVTELLTLRAGPSFFPAGCAIDLYAKTSVTSSPPTLNVGSADGTNLAIVVNQPL